MPVQGHLCYEGHFPDAIQGFSRSIVAGCTSSSTLVRAILKDPIEASAAEAPGCHHCVHFDDVSQSIHHESDKVVAEEAVAAGSCFADDATSSGLELSPKSVVVSNCPRVADFIAHELRALGFPVTADA